MSRQILKTFKNCQVHLNEIDTSSYEKNLLGNFDNVYNCNFLDIKGEFDILIAIDVLEHFDNLKEFYDKTNRLNLEYLVFQVPFERPIKQSTDNLDFHPHYHMFSKTSILKMFEKDYNLINWRSTQHDYSAKGPEQICIFKRKKK